MRATALVMIGAWVLGCGPAPRVGSIADDVETLPVALEVACGDEASDALTVRAVDLRGATTLLVDVTHPGGCADHTYRVCGAREVLRTEPGQWALTVLHDAHGDSCTRGLRRVLSVGLDRHAVGVAGVHDRSVTVLVR